MNVALTGLTPREALALEMLIGKMLPDWRCSVASASPQAALPSADLYVVDLTGRGMSRWSEAGQASLLQALGGAPAVLIASAFDQTWSALEAQNMKHQSLTLLRKPYGIEDMRTALKQAAAGRPKPAMPLAAVVARVAVAAVAPVTPVTPVTPVAPAAAHAPAPPTATAVVDSSWPVPAMPAVEIGELSPVQFQARLKALPPSEPHRFLRQLGQALALRRPFEVRVSFLNRLIFNPGERWVASNTPTSVIQGLCQSDELAAATSIDAVDEKDVMARAQRLDLQLQPLEVFLWSLMPARRLQQSASLQKAS